MRKLPLHRSAHAVLQLYLHMVFVTQGRGKTFDVEKDEAGLRLLFEDICRRIGGKLVSNPDRADHLCELIEFGMGEDHVHLVLRYPATITVAQLAQYLKGISSREWSGKKKRGEPNAPDRLWSSSYFAKTVGHMSIEGTIAYASQDSQQAKEERKNATTLKNVATIARTASKLSDESKRRV
jgi:putative transposase